MAHSTSTPDADPTLLPDSYDELLPVEQLVHGEHNPRRVRPTETLAQSIASFGINDPLIVRPDPDEDVYHITDGWQRYQAAVACGWEHLPVKIYEDTLAALEATEMESIVREWSTYEWAQYCHSLAAEIEADADSKTDLARQVATRTSREPETVRRYLDVLALPEAIHILLADGPDGSDQQWAALQNHNQDVRQYGNLQWRVADRLARNRSELSPTRLLAIAATAVEFETTDQAIEFVDLAIAEPETRVDILQREILLGGDHDRYLLVPRVAVELSTEQKQAVMDYCCDQRRSLSDIVSEGLTALATDLTDASTDGTSAGGTDDTGAGDTATTGNSDGTAASTDTIAGTTATDGNAGDTNGDTTDTAASASGTTDADGNAGDVGSDDAGDVGSNDAGDVGSNDAGDATGNSAGGATDDSDTDVPSSANADTSEADDTAQMESTTDRGDT